MKKILILCLSAITLIACCHRQSHVSHVETAFIDIDSTLDAIQDTAYLHHLRPLHDDLEAQLTIPLGHAPEALWIGHPESPLPNWTCDALLDIAKLHYDGHIDLAVVNMGGLRCEWPAGDITFRNVFELMPFDNELVILTLSGQELLLLAENCVTQGGEGVSATFRVQGANKQVTSVTLNGKPIRPEADYFVATSDYLSGGADGLTALTHFTHRHYTGLKIRDLFIAHLQAHPLVEAHVDGRMFILQ